MQERMIKQSNEVLEKETESRAQGLRLKIESKAHHLPNRREKSDGSRSE